MVGTNVCVECQQCGKCCIEFVSGFSATENDIIRWRQEKRDDILEYVYFMDENETYGDLFFNPRTGEEIYTRCPFLRKIRNKNQYVCRIHETKPEVCRNYPNHGENPGICLKNEV